MLRLPDWQPRLGRYLEWAAVTPFKYGTLDCGLFVADSLLAITGHDVALHLRGRYANRREAFAKIRAIHGYSTMANLAKHLACCHELTEVAVEFAQRGDPVVIGSSRKSHLGIVALHGSEILTPFRSGLLRLPFHYASRAWRV